MIKLNETKISLVGYGGVGKTSIVKQLQNVGFSNAEHTTRGIQITDFIITSEDEWTKLKVWDFGGQEIYHSIHELFLTKNTIYLVVIDARQENEINNWIETILNLVGEVPIIIVINKIDLYPSFDIDRTLATSIYPNIVGIVQVSCKLEIRFSELKKLIFDSIKLQKNLLVPESWGNVKNEIETLSNNFIEYDTFKSICSKYGISNQEEQNLLSDFLHDLGVIVHFKYFSLYNTQILNPLWITEAIYIVFNSEIALLKKGILSYFDIETIFKNFKNTYPSNKIQYVIGIMIQFELILKLEKDLYIIPMLLQSSEPQFKFDYSKSRQFSYDYTFLPTTLFSKIICRVVEKFRIKYFWRNGLVLTRQDSTALIRKDKSKNHLVIHVLGDQRKEVSFILKQIIESINLNYPRIQTELLIAIEQGESKALVKYSVLVAYEKNGIATILHPDTLEAIYVKSILDQFNPEQKEILSPIQVFVSYSHTDKDFKSELVKHINPLVRLNKISLWEDGKIVPGQEWEVEIMNKLNESNIILCLISSDFISSEFCYSIELNEALSFHERKQKVVIPILIRACFWKELPIAKIQGIPQKPISSSTNKDEAWEEVITGINNSLKLIRSIKYGT